MEGAINRLVSGMDGREKHILELESELLRVDYEYGVIVKDLKEKYSRMGQDLSLTHHALKQAKRENKRLQAILSAKEKEIELMKLGVEQRTMKETFHEEALKRVKQENEMLRNEIKYLEASAGKCQIKVQEAIKKKEQYREEVARLEEKVQYLQKQIKKSQAKRKQLQELVEQEVLETQQRIQSIGVEFYNKNNLASAEKGLAQSREHLESLNKTVEVERKPELAEVVNDWESDMKKLKNCIDYGNSYILVFDPSNLDRSVSRQIFRHLRKCLKQINDQSDQLLSLKQQQSSLLRTQKEKLRHLEEELERISEEKRTRVKVDVQMQTEHAGGDAQRVICQLGELNTKLKIKNAGLIQCVDLMALRNVAVISLLDNSHLSLRYWKKIDRRERQPVELKPLSRFRKNVLSVLFIQMLSKQSSSSKRSKSLKSNPREQKIRSLIDSLQKQCPENVQLQKLKDSLIIDHSSLPTRTEQIITYYQYKLQSYLQTHSISQSLR